MSKQIQAIIDEVNRLDTLVSLLKSNKIDNPKELSEDIEFLEDKIKHSSITYIRVLIDYIEELEYYAADNQR